MIIYFTGTGNSLHLAKKVGEAINEIPVNSFEYIKECKRAALTAIPPMFLYARLTLGKYRTFLKSS